MKNYWIDLRKKKTSPFWACCYVGGMPQFYSPFRFGRNTNYPYGQLGSNTIEMKSADPDFRTFVIKTGLPDPANFKAECMIVVHDEDGLIVEKWALPDIEIVGTGWSSSVAHDPDVYWAITCPAVKNIKSKYFKL